MTNIYQPFKVKIKKIEKHSDNVKLFRLVREKGKFLKNKQTKKLNLNIVSIIKANQ